MKFSGVGIHGHIASNEPGSSLVSRTRVKTLAMDTIQGNAHFFDGDSTKAPHQGLTVGVGTVMDAKEVGGSVFSKQGVGRHRRHLLLILQLLLLPKSRIV